MIVAQGIVVAAKTNGDDNMAGQFVAPGKRAMRARQIVDLLTERTMPAAQSGARILLREMSTHRWMVVASIHRSSDDNTPHVTIEVHRTRYHLRLGGDHAIFDIVNNRRERVGGRLPWVAPGA